jgi:hypothetical protein
MESLAEARPINTLPLHMCIRAKLAESNLKQIHCARWSPIMLSNTDDAPLFQAIFSNCQVPLLVGIHCESSSSLAEESSDVLDKENIVDTKN